MAMPDAQIGTVISPRQTSSFETEGVSLRRASLWGDAWRRLIKNKLAIIGGIGVLVLILTALVADQLMRFGYARQHLADHGVSPNPTYWLGADLLGRDLYSRIIYGARISMEVGLITQLFATLIGVTIGSLAGFYAGRTDNAIMRAVDVIYSIPVLFFAILVMESLGKSVNHIILALSLTSWPIIARLTRAQMLSIREKEYIKAARLSGGRGWQIIMRHMLPNSMTPIHRRYYLRNSGRHLYRGDAQLLRHRRQPAYPELGADGGGIRKERTLILVPGSLPVGSARAYDAFIHLPRRRNPRRAGSSHE